MAITRNELLEAIRTVVSSEFEHVPKNEDEIEYRFTAGFMKRMLRLFRNQKKAYWKYVNTAAKRVAVILVSAAVLFATACSIKPIREPIIRFITEVYETFTAYFFQGDTVKAIEKVYSLEEPPEGFAETKKTIYDNIITTIYKNDRGDTIIITQMSTTENQLIVDREANNAEIEFIEGIEVVINRIEAKTQAVYIKGSYSFQIDCVGDIDIEVVKQIIADLK